MREPIDIEAIREWLSRGGEAAGHNAFVARAGQGEHLVVRLLAEIERLSAAVDGEWAQALEAACALEVMTQARDDALAWLSEARAEVERLTRERDEARRALMVYAGEVALMPDHACAECAPDGPVVINGFRCAAHYAASISEER